MENKINKITFGKFLYAVFGGFIINALIAMAISLALSIKYKIFLYGNNGDINLNITILIMICLSAFLGGLFAGGVIRKRGYLFGMLTVLIPFCISLLIIWLYSIGKTLTESGQIWFIRSMKNMIIFTTLQIPFSSIGGILGQKSWSLAEDQEDEDLLEVYFKPHIRILFIVPIVCLAIYLMVYYFDRLYLYLKWLFIGSYYILVHPSLWIDWYVLPFYECLFLILILVFTLPLGSIFLISVIWNKKRNILINILLTILLIFGVILGTSLADKAGYAPIRWTVDKIASKGGKVWDILLDKELARLQKPVIVIPGESIMDVKVEMSKQEVISILGYPKQLNYAVDPEGNRVEILGYNNPGIVMILDKNNKVHSINLSYVNDVDVIGYDFLEFKYLTEEEFNVFGKPDSVYRDLNSEKLFTSKAPEGTILECYFYNYKKIGLALGFAFDRIRQKENKKYITLYQIVVSNHR